MVTTPSFRKLIYSKKCFVKFSTAEHGYFLSLPRLAEAINIIFFFKGFKDSHPLSVVIK